MQNIKNYRQITPEGTRDLLFEECTARRAIERGLSELFREAGYSEVITPFLEFYDLFNSNRRFPQESMYKLTDAKGRLMVIRPDSTLPIIRLAETRLKDKPRPLRLCYNQTIYRANPKEAGRDDEIAQSGIEFIGGEPESADYEALTIAVKALALISEEYSFEIGDCGIFNALIAREGLDGEQAEKITRLIESKNYPELKRTAPDIIAELPKLFGGAEVFGKAEALFKNGTEKVILAELKSLYGKLDKAAGNGKITIDLGLTDKRGYYTGVVFNGYAPDYGKPVLSGGRYRLSGTDAIGFAVNVSAVAELRYEGGLCGKR